MHNVNFYHITKQKLGLSSKNHVDIFISANSIAILMQDPGA